MGGSVNVTWPLRRPSGLKLEISGGLFMKQVMYGTVSALALMLAVTGGANAAGTDQAALAASATARQAEKRKHRAMAAARLNHCFKSLAALAFDFFGRHSRPSNSL
jgi:hypothetical protein